MKKMAIKPARVIPDHPTVAAVNCVAPVPRTMGRVLPPRISSKSSMVTTRTRMNKRGSARLAGESRRMKRKMKENENKSYGGTGCECTLEFKRSFKNTKR